jgi:gamma-glutamylcyclotransferase (GGCT)/AIG2-like uncharacterized protein YtfP
MPEYLFSYGTLQPELAPAEVEPIARIFRPVCRAYIHGVLYDFGAYPGAVPGGGEKVWGQVFELSPDPLILRRLDEYEGFDPLNIDASQFTRQKCGAIVDNGQVYEAWVYFYNLDVGAAVVITSGEFVKL